MGAREFTRSQRFKLRQISELAYERELSRELAVLEADFQRWRSGQLKAKELCDRIHEFHQGPAQKLFARYDRPNLEFSVAHAIHSGLVSNAEAGDEVLELVRSHLAFYRESDSVDPANPPELSDERKEY
jgi:hypothetical protein